MQHESADIIAVGASSFVWIYRFGNDGKAESISALEPHECGALHDSFFWVHLNLADVRSRNWLQKVDRLPVEAKALMLSSESHHQLIAADGFVWGVLSDFRADFGTTYDEPTDLRMVVAEGFVLTGRKHPVQAVAATRDALINGLRVMSSADLFEAIAQRIIEAMEKASRTLALEIDTIEDRVLDDHTHDDRRKLGPRRREAVRLTRQAAGMHRVLLHFDRPASLCEPLHLIALRLLQKLEAIQQDLRETLERARFLHEEIGSKLTAETNRQLYILTILGTLLMPPTLITGIFGMNTKGLMFGDDENGFLYATIMFCILSASLAYAAMLIIRRPQGA